MVQERHRLKSGSDARCEGGRTTKYQVRTCKRSDLHSVTELELSSFPDPYDAEVFRWFLSHDPRGFLVAVDEDSQQVLGYIISTVREGSGLIVSIAVDRRYGRRGIGTSLMRSALGHLSESTHRVVLQVRWDNHEAISFYRGLSFEEVGRIPGYYSNGDDALVMALDLSKTSLGPQR
jgi:ribosomal-protein-alanine N-acetyltransferase